MLPKKKIGNFNPERRDLSRLKQNKQKQKLIGETYLCDP